MTIFFFLSISIFLSGNLCFFHQIKNTKQNQIILRAIFFGDFFLLGAFAYALNCLLNNNFFISDISDEQKKQN